VTAQDIVAHLLDSVDPDDPVVFMKHYEDAFTRAGFALVSSESTGQPKWVWQAGPRRIEVQAYDCETAADDDIPCEAAEQAGALSAGFGVGLFGPAGVESYQVVRTEQEAAQLALNWQRQHS
jgi:hypothetical protein